MGTIAQTVQQTSLHRTIMRKLCLGVSLEAIAQDCGVEVAHLEKVVKAPLFQQELNKMQAAVDTEVAQQAAELEAEKDPIIKKLRGLVPRAINRLGAEIDNFDPEQGATAGTRLKAVEMVIAMEGTYSPKKDNGPAAPTVILNFSPAKLDAVKKKMGLVIDIPQEAPA